MGRGAVNRAYYRVAKDSTWEFEIYNPTGSKTTINHCKYFILGY